VVPERNLNASDEIDLESNDIAARFKPGTGIVTLGRDNEALVFS
jgi:hypothetical protein